jgi:hypothetical protein
MSGVKPLKGTPKGPPRGGLRDMIRKFADSEAVMEIVFEGDPDVIRKYLVELMESGSYTGRRGPDGYHVVKKEIAHG